MRVFEEIAKRDKAWIEDWMLSWDYQDNKKPYKKEFPQNFYHYSGPGDLEKWWAWQSRVKRPHYFQSETYDALMKMSRKFDKRVAKKLNISFNCRHYDAIGQNNAQDYLMTHYYMVPDRQKVNRVIDFGAGYGRQVNLWSQLESELQYVGIDAIPQSYCLQHLYYSCLEDPLNEYMDDPQSFEIKGPGFYHLPTWRTDLLPNDHFDMVLLTQVLSEINEKLVHFLIDTFWQKLKNGGALYIRDHGSEWTPVHHLDIDELLIGKGFVLEFKPYIIDKKDIHGIPRIWRKNH